MWVHLIYSRRFHPRRDISSHLFSYVLCRLKRLAFIFVCGIKANSFTFLICLLL